MKKLNTIIFKIFSISICIIFFTIVFVYAKNEKLSISKMAMDFSEKVDKSLQINNIKEQYNSKIYLNGKAIDLMGCTVINANSSTLIPIAPIAKALDGKTEWNSENKIVVFAAQNKVVECIQGSNKVIINGTTIKEGNVCTINYNSRIHLPIRLLSESLDLSVEYDSKTKDIYISTKITEDTTEMTTEVIKQTLEESTTEVTTQLTKNSKNNNKKQNNDNENITDCVFTANDGPDKGDLYYKSYNIVIRDYRMIGLSDEQINSNLKVVKLCPYNDIDSQNYKNWIKENRESLDKANISKPARDGKFKGEIAEGGYLWNGNTWNINLYFYFGVEVLD